MATKTATKAQHNSVSAKLGSKIDALYSRRQERLAKQRELDALKAKEEAAEQEVLALLDTAKLSKAAGKVASVSVAPKTVGQVEPERWNDVYAYIKKHGAFDLLQRRLNNTAYRERIEAGENIPGTKSVTVLDLSVRAL